jgi:hypothetical protein
MLLNEIGQFCSSNFPIPLNGTMKNKVPLALKCKRVCANDFGRLFPSGAGFTAINGGCYSKISAKDFLAFVCEVVIRNLGKFWPSVVIFACGCERQSFCFIFAKLFDREMRMLYCMVLVVPFGFPSNLRLLFTFFFYPEYAFLGFKRQASAMSYFDRHRK